MRVRGNMKDHLPRATVFRSLKQIYIQIIDDKTSRTLASCSSFELDSKSGDKKAIAYEVGKKLAAQAIEKGISQITFDRGPYLFHGRVKALADGLIEGGLKI